MRLNRGWLIVLEGIDGVGKSTQCRMLREYLEGKQVPVVQLYEPTHGTWGKQVRKILVEGRNGISPEKELDLFIKDRMENVELNIMPALDDNKVVLIDRYYYSTAAYQGALDLDPNMILEKNQAFAPKPDCVLFMTLPVEQSLERIKVSRGEEPNEFEKLDYLKRVQEIFNSFSDDNFVPIDCSPPLNDVHKSICDAVDRLLQLDTCAS